MPPSNRRLVTFQSKHGFPILLFDELSPSCTLKIELDQFREDVYFGRAHKLPWLVLIILLFRNHVMSVKGIAKSQIPAQESGTFSRSSM